MDCESDVKSMTERADSTRKEVVDYDGGREGTGQMGQTRPSGIVARGVTNSRESEQAVFRGKETLRKLNR